jgi:uncharacterized membrane protein YheB (UPF0754 family)
MSESVQLEWIILIPFVAGFIGWVTNWLAIKMIFYPRNYWGIRVGPLSLGWQGIIHKKASSFATSVGKQVSENMIQASELVPKITDKHMNAFIERFPELWKELEQGDFLPELLGQHWDSMSPMQRQLVKMQIRFDSRALILELVKVARGKFMERFDIREVVSRRLSHDSQLLAQLFANIARPELKRIELYGLVFGAFIGTVEAFLFLFTELSGTIFIFGILIGAITNWLAIEMIFRPREKTRFLGINYQGLFPKRQSEIAMQFATICETHVLPVSAFVEEVMAVLEQPDFIEELDQTSKRWLMRLIKNYQEYLPEGASVEHIADKAIEIYYQKQPTIESEIIDEMESLLRPDYKVAELIRENLSQLPKDKFERVLRVVFEQDETTLIAIGALLGLVISGVQFSMFA